MAANKTRIAAIAAIASALAVPAEGLRQAAYRDPGGVLTVCYGHTGQDIAPGKHYTQAECEALLTADMLAAVKAVEACQPGLPVHVAAAFSDAVYNLGPKIACGPGSTAARLLEAGDYVGACNQLPRWNKARIGGIAVSFPGLTTRREVERRVCLGEVPL